MVINTPFDHGKDAEKPRCAGLYREDVVQSVAQPGVLGLVAKVAGDSDSDSSDSEDEENKGDDDALSQGSARVCWANSEESTHKIEDIHVVDRSFLHGDIVARVSAPMEQTGMVTNVDLRVDLQLPNGEVISNVDSKTIKRVHTFTVGEYVISEQWLGRVDEIYDNVTVMFEDGAKCKIACADPERLVPISVSPMDDSECPYYPGQHVKANFTGLFKAARWLKGSWKPSRIEGTVIDVGVDSLVIYWMAAASTGHKSQAPGIPAERQNPKNVKRLTNFSYTSWQLGDRALLPQRLARKGPVMSSVPLEQDAHSDNEAEAAEKIEQAQEPGCLEAGKLTTTSGKEPSVDSWVAYRRKVKRRFTKHKKKTLKKDDFCEHALLIVGTKTKVDVVWQDGTREKGVDTCSLFPVDHLGDHDFWPEQHVMERGSDLDGFEPEISRRAGIVETVDSKQRTARVRWLAPTSHPQKWPCFESEEIVSVYELIEHPDYDYCLGDVVIRLSPMVDLHKEPGNSSLTAEVKDSTGADCEQEQELASCSTGVGAPETESNTSAVDLSWVGIITAIQDGQIEVAWADGEVSKVGSQAIFVVGRDEDDGSSQTSAVEMDEEMDDAGSWTTIESTEMNDGEEEQELGQSEGYDESEVRDGGSKHSHYSDEAGKQLLNSSGDVGESSVRHPESDTGLGSILSLPFGALIRALKFAASLLWALRGVKRHESASRQDMRIPDAQCEGADKATRAGEHSSTSRKSLDNASLSLSEKSLVLPEDNTVNEVVAQGGDAMDTDALAETEKKNGFNGGINETVQEYSLPTVPQLDVSGLFKQFDSVKDTADHHFKDEDSQPTNQRRWSKKVHQEWAMLEKCLPDTIFVRVYENRMDLMRSVIVGAKGTPYHDGLFFFDLYLPSEYPSSPPHVHYHSGGLRLNPNLYETGKVCLSLLNTWTGKGNEIWHSSSSSILQVLVSIQGLVLNSNPYFNEAGYEKHMGTAEGEKNSLAYVENTFLLSCKSMIYLIRRPPTHFEEFVRDHFKHRGPCVLQACLAYMQGCPVGSSTDEGVTSPSPLGTAKDYERSTVGFRLMLAKIIPRLFAAFKEVGAICGPYEEQFNSIKQVL